MTHKNAEINQTIDHEEILRIRGIELGTIKYVAKTHEFAIPSAVPDFCLPDTEISSAKATPCHAETIIPVITKQGAM